KTYIKSIIALPAPARLFLLTEALFGLSMGLWGLNLNFHLKAIGFSGEQVGIILALGTIGTACLSLIAGPTLSRVGFRKAMYLGCIVKGIGLLLIAISVSFPAVILSQLLSSLGDAFVLSVEFPFILSLVTEKDRHKVYNLLMFMFLGAMIIGNIVGGYIPLLFKGYSRPFMVPLIISAIVFTLMGVFRSRLPESGTRSQTRIGLIEGFKSRKAVAFLIYAIIGGFSANLLSSMSNLVMRDFLKFTEANVGVILSVATLASCISTFVVPMLLEKFKSTGLAVISQIIGISALVVLAFVDARLFVVFWILNNYVRAMLPGVIDSPMLQAIPVEKQGSYSGMRIFTGQLGQSAGSFTAGMMLTYSNYSMLMLCAAAASVIQLAIYFFICKKHIV
ncbi:MAG: MFS transporter, partial [Clostridiales bacterium]|nr:MFS transporter [Clostridiales bacterium]